MDCNETIKRTWLSVRKLAPERFDKFRLADDPDASYALARYKFDLSVRESLNPTISGTEIALRNGIHRALTKRYGPRWYDGTNLYFHDHEQGALDKTFALLQRRRGIPKHSIEACDVVSHLSMGFWVGLMHEMYQASVWPFFGTDEFLRQGVKKEHLIGREAFMNRLNHVKNLRNRMAHNEPLVLNPNVIHPKITVPNVHQQALQIIEWINPRYAKLIKLDDRFPGLWEGGLEPFRQKILAEFCYDSD